MNHAENVPEVHLRKRSAAHRSFSSNVMPEEEYDALRKKSSQRGRAVDREVNRLKKSIPPDVSAPEGYTVIPDHDFMTRAGASIRGYEVIAYNAIAKVWCEGVIESVNFRRASDEHTYHIMVVNSDGNFRGFLPKLVFKKNN